LADRQTWRQPTDPGRNTLRRTFLYKLLSATASANVKAAALSSVRDGNGQRRCCQQEVTDRGDDVAVLAGAQVYSDRSQEEQDQPNRGRDADVPDA
jgi:hypothetical protein